MRRVRAFSLLKELLNFLPSRPRKEWQERSQLDRRKPTIVLVSGFGANERNLGIFRKRFKKDGFNVVILPLDWQSFSDGFRGFYRLSEDLLRLLIALRKGPLRWDHKLFIVAHSAGGLVARYCLQILGGVHYCNGLVTLATPHQGTWVALLGFFSHLILKFRCLVQLLPGSAFIKKINRSALPVDFHFMSVYSKDDLMCSIDSSRLSIALVEQSHYWENIEIPKLAHSDFLYSKECYQVVSEFLRKELDQPVISSPPSTPSTLPVNH